MRITLNVYFLKDMSDFHIKFLTPKFSTNHFHPSLYNKYQSLIITAVIIYSYISLFSNPIQVLDYSI